MWPHYNCKITGWQAIKSGVRALPAMRQHEYEKKALDTGNVFL